MRSTSQFQTWLSSVGAKLRRARRPSRRAPWPAAPCETLDAKLYLEVDNSQVANNTTAGRQWTWDSDRTVAMDAEGNFVAVWNSYHQDGSFQGVYARRYDANENPVGDEFLVNNTTLNHQLHPSIAMRPEGDFVIAWESGDGGGYGIYARRFNAEAEPEGSEFQVNTVIGAHQQRPTVAMDAEGDFVIAWSTDSAFYGIPNSVSAQRFDADGDRAGEEISVNTAPLVNVNVEPTIAMDADGDFVVAWSSYASGADGIKAQRFNAAGAPQGGEFRVNTHTASFKRHASVGMDADGDFVVAWASEFHQDGSGFGVFARRYDAAGDAVGDEFLVNSITYNDQTFPSVAMEPDGDFVIAWESNAYLSYGGYAQRFNAAGARLGSEMRYIADASQSVSNTSPSVAVNPSGTFVLAWTGAGVQEDVYVRLSQLIIKDDNVIETYAENGARLLAPTGGIENPGQVAFDGGRLLVQYTDTPLPGLQASSSRSSLVAATQGAGAIATDRLTIRHQGTGANQVGVNGNDVTYSGTVVGTLSGGTAGQDLAVTFNAAATRAAVQAVFRNLQYSNASDDPTNGGANPQRRLLLQVTGAEGASLPITQTINLTAVNDRPILGAIPSSQTYTENDDSHQLAPLATVVDPDSADFAGGQLTVKHVAGGLASDALTIRHEGTEAGQVGVSGDDVLFGGTPIGTFTGGAGLTPLVISLNASSSVAAAEAVLRNILYQNDSDNPTNFGARPSRTINYVLTDGDGGTSLAVNQTLHITAVNDQPAVAGIPSSQAYRENGAAKLLAPQATVVDPDSINFDGGKLAVKYTAGGLGSDRLTIRHQGTGPGQVGVSGNTLSVGGVAIGTFTGGTGLQPLVVTFNADAKPLRVQAVLRNIAYHNISDNPTNFGANPGRTVNYVLFDGDDGGGPGTEVNQTLNITAVNDRPVLAAIPSSQTYTENDAPKLLAPEAAVADSDSAEFNGGRLAVKFAAGGLGTDRLTIRPQGTGPGQVAVSGGTVSVGGAAVGTFVGGAGAQPLVFTFNADATPLRVQAVLRSIQYQNVSDNPTKDGSNTTRTVNYVLIDGDGGTSVAVNQTLDITATNDPPALVAIPSTLTYTEGPGHGAKLPLALATTIADPDSANFDGGKLTVTISEGSLNFDSLGIRSTWAGPVYQTGHNDVGFNGTIIGSYTGHGTPSLEITFNAEANLLHVRAVLRHIEYYSVNRNPTNFGANPTRTVRYVLTDGDGGTSVAVNQTINITPFNDNPWLSAFTSSQSYHEHQAARLLAPDATIDDPDSSTFDNGELRINYGGYGVGSDRLTIRHQGTGPGQVGVSGDTLTVGGIAVATFVGGTGLQDLVLTFNADATPLRVQAVLRNIQYQNLSDNPTDFGARPYRNLQFKLTDGDGGESRGDTVSVYVYDDNDATVVNNFADASTYTTSAAATILDANATVTDPDSADFAGGNLVLQFTTGAVGSNRLEIRNQGTGANQIGVSGSNVTFAGTVIGTLNANAGSGLNALIVTFTPAATPAAVQALLRNVTYRSTVANPTGPKTLTLNVRDGDGGLTTVNKTLNIAPALMAAPRSATAFAAYADWESAL